MIVTAVEFDEDCTSTIATLLGLPVEKIADTWSYKEVEKIRMAARKHYVNQQRRRCCYCMTEIPTESGKVWEVEHIVSRNEKPEFCFEPKNLAIICPDCNSIKQHTKVLSRKCTHYPRSSGAFLIIHPHFDKFDDHIWVLAKYLFVPVTKKGVKTIDACNLFRMAAHLVGLPGFEGAEAEIENIIDEYKDAERSSKQVFLLKLRALIEVGFRLN